MRIALVGQPNVGKSSVLNLLCGRRALVSNYPGTTVAGEAARLPGPGGLCELWDTPGLHSLSYPSSERRLVRTVLAAMQGIINVVDATDLPRHLLLTLELTELDLPLVLCVNQLDRARRQRIPVDLQRLSQLLGVPVVGTSAVTGQGREELIAALSHFHHPGPAAKGVRSSPQRTSEDRWQLLQTLEGEWATWPQSTPRLENWMRHPVVFAFLGAAGAYAVARLLLVLLRYTEFLVARLLIPLAQALRQALSWLPVDPVWSGFAVEGLVVPLGVVLPAMVVVYLIMTMLEDSGLFARLAALLHIPCRWVGLSGPCMIPLFLGTGCRLVGVLGSRVIPGERERGQTCALLAIAVPCAATLAVMGALVSHKGADVSVVMGTSLLAVLVTSLLWRGETTPLALEISPLRWPSWGNLTFKMAHRMRGFFLTVLPLLALTNVLVRAGLERGVFSWLERYDGTAHAWFGLSGTALAGLGVTVVQRYLAPLVLLSVELSPRQATIASSMIIISFPCFPVAVLCWRELGARQAMAIYGLAIALPLGVGHLLHRLLP